MQQQTSNTRKQLAQQQQVDEFASAVEGTRHSNTGKKYSRQQNAIIHQHGGIHHQRNNSGGLQLQHYSQQQTQHLVGQPMAFPILQLDGGQSRNKKNELGGIAKTQQTPLRQGASTRNLNNPGTFITITEAAQTRKSCAVAGDPKTPQKNSASKQHSQQHQNGNSAQKTKTGSRKSTKPKATNASNAANNQKTVQAQQPQGPDPLSIRESNLKAAEQKLSKYDKMLQSLEAVAIKQRNNTNTDYGSAKKNTVMSTEGSDPLMEAFKSSLDTAKERHQFDTRGALSMSSGISKNTGTCTMVAREKIAQLHHYQQQQQQMIYLKQSIFDRNRPWNCEYCQPKTVPRILVDNKINLFSRQCVSSMVSRFMIKEEFYESRKVVELLNTNSRSVLVAQFKDFLIYDDIYEFLTSLYDQHTSLDILTRHAVFYDSLAQLEVLCQYREDQIRDRHLVLHGLKPCYVGVEKQIQSILSSNFRNKIRIVINKVRKVQIARGQNMEESSNNSQDTGSSQSTPQKQPNRLLSAKQQQRAAEVAKKQKDFKKLIQSSMVREYNFSRSQSGMLIAKDSMSTSVNPNTLFNRHHKRFDTNSSINFTNLSYEHEVELLKGSVFENSIEKSFDEFYPQKVGEIESMYMNAQMILDDLSSRPLTRQSMPKENNATPASRINMYELHKQEEHQKIRLPFCLAPEKPVDQNSCSDNANSASLIVQRDEIMIINDGDRQVASSVSVFQKQPMLGQVEDKNSIKNLLTEESAKKIGQFQLYVLPNTGDQSLEQPDDSITAMKDIKNIVETQITSEDTRQDYVKTATGASERNQIIGQLTAAQIQQKRQLLPPPSSEISQYGGKNINDAQQQKVRPIKLKNNLDKNQSNNQSSAGNNSTSFKQAGNGPGESTQKTTINADKQIKTKKISNVTPSHIISDPLSLERPTKQRGGTGQCPKNMNNPGSTKASQRIHLVGRGTPKKQQQHQQLLVRTSTTGCKNFSNFATQQNKAMAMSTRTLPTAQSIVKPISAKKAQNFNENYRASQSQEDFAEQISHRFTEQAEHEQMKVSKKLISSIKSNIQMSPNQAQRLNQNFDQDLEMLAPKERVLVEQPMSPTSSVPISRQLKSKNFASTKNMSQNVVKPCSFQHGQRGTIHASNQSKFVKSSAKRDEERIKASSSKKNIIVGSAFSSEKPSLSQQQISQDQQKPQRMSKQAKNQLSLKEQVILEALRKEQQSQSNQHQPGTGLCIKRSASGTQYFAQGDPQGVKLLRSQHMTAPGGVLSQSKSLVAQKFDLFGVASKLKLLGQPSITKSGTMMPQQQPMQRLQDSQNRKSSIKFNSRKVSVEKKDEILYSRNNTNSGLKQQSLRFFSEDRQMMLHNCEEGNIHLPLSSQVIKEKVPSNKNSAGQKRKLIPANQQINAYYTQRSNNQHRASAIQNSASSFHTSQLTPVPQFHSRNSKGLSCNDGGSQDQRHSSSHVQLVSKTVTDLQQKLQTRSTVQKQNLVTSTGSKKKIQKLNRAVTGSVMSPKGLGLQVYDDHFGGAGAQTGPVISPRKLTKTNEGRRNTENKGNGSQTQSSQRIVTFHQGGLKQQASKQQLQPQNQQYQQHLHQVSTLSPSAHSRNGQTLQSNTAPKHAMTNAMNELAASKGLGSGNKHMQSQQLMQVAQQNQFVTNTQLHQQKSTALKQELKLHSRKSSAVYSLNQNQKLQTIGSNQGTNLIQTGVTKSFGGACIPSSSSAATIQHKKTTAKKKLKDVQQ